MSASLTYYISQGLLTGLADGHMVNIHAMSGGGGGSTKNPDGNADTNNPSAESLQEKQGKGGHRGGPLPSGRYKIGTPIHRPHLGLSAELEPYDKEQASHMYGRSGFFIHGRGPLGSDGCIVPMESFHDLMAWLQKDRGGALFVLDAMLGDFDPKASEGLA
jgi:hypothetical protein